ncbi:MAG: SDR family NAD(P)-dependent oxidoreductase, partial [Alphaproteobacteria bacterium]
MNAPLAGRRFLVTGAGAGIGAVIARTIVGRGGRVALLDRDAARASAGAAALGPSARAVVADVTRGGEATDA